MGGGYIIHGGKKFEVMNEDKLFTKSGRRKKEWDMEKKKNAHRFCFIQCLIAIQYLDGMERIDSSDLPAVYEEEAKGNYQEAIYGFDAGEPSGG